MSAPSELTQLLLDWSRGDKNALDKLMPLVYDELRSLARRYLSRESVGHTLQTTALVNEAYMRLIDQSRVQWQNRAHFFAICAQMMRRILVDHARKQQYAKRGGGAVKISLDDIALLSNEKAAELVALDEALEKLAGMDSRRSRVVELRFFGGLNNEEIASVLGISANTVMRDWNLAKAWLYKSVTKNE
jgi:RNA polymerase sigma-70 factor, ECF subfamily